MKPGRNDPCHCGSGQKYKKCCATKDDAEHKAELAAKAAERAAVAEAEAAAAPKDAPKPIPAKAPKQAGPKPKEPSRAPAMFRRRSAV